MPTMSAMGAHHDEFCLVFGCKSADIFKDAAYANVWLESNTFVFKLADNVLKLGKCFGNLGVF